METGLSGMNENKKIAVFENVSKSYGRLPALESVSFNIEQGEIFGFIGPNGAGKTTTIKILVGLLTDFAGRVTVEGRAMPDERLALTRTIGYMPQNVAFQEWRTVEQALVTFGRLSGLDRIGLAARIPQVLEDVGLSDVRSKRIIHLSGGMVQKLGIAQALLHEPRFVILDEPLSGLDPGSRIRTKSLMKRLSGAGTTVFFSSHILSDVQDVAHRIGIIAKGRMLDIATLEELKSRFSARNVMEIVLSHDAGTWKDAGAVSGVERLEQAGDGRLLLYFVPRADEDETINLVTQSLIGKGNKIRSFKLLAPSLDDLYLRLVQGLDWEAS